MSVINKMLQDLDSRSNESSHTATTTRLPIQGMSPIKVIIITVLLMLCLTALTFAVWQIYQENQTLKQQVQKESQTKVMLSQSGAQQLASSPQAIEQSRIDDSSINIPSKQLAVVEVSPSEKLAAVSSTVIDKTPESEPSAQQESTTPPLTSDVNDHGHYHNETDSTGSGTEIPPVVEPKLEKKSSLTISRKQMSPQELARRKMNKAERALADNKIEQAELLFEEILILTPKNAVARKQLAALWYGRKSYQPALNLLQQGLVLDSANQEFRLMKARIYLTIGQVEKAYDVLSVLHKINNIEYQSLLANAAQQLGKHKAAATAYLKLVQLAPQNARYWLGLAIAYDSNSQFSEAVTAYRSALNQGGLSSSALTFVKQRMEELGE